MSFKEVDHFLQGFSNQEQMGKRAVGENSF